MIKIFEPFQLWPQWLATLTVNLLLISNGLSAGWTSPYLALLTSNDAPFRITENEGSWIASLLPLGCLLGAIIGPLVLEYMGSKTTVLLSGLPISCCWICMTCATSPIWLYITKILSGITMGMTLSSFPFYVGEISAPSIRGALGCLIINGLPIGTLLGNIMGSNMSMMYFGITSLIVTLCFVGIFSFFPRTPHYYVQHNDTKRAEQAIRWYYRKSDVRSEIESVEHFVKSMHAMSLRERLKQIKGPKYRQSFIITIVAAIFAQFSGLNTIILYMEIILKKGKVTSITPSTVVIIVNAIGIIIGFIGVFAIERGRKIATAISSVGVMVGMALLGLHFFLLDYNYDPTDLEWLIILSLLMIMLMNFGVVPLSVALVSEIFPTELKSIGGFIGCAITAIAAFVASKTYQPLIDLIGETYLFWIYAVIFLISLIYSLTVLPETKGKTLNEIQDMIARNTTQKSQRDACHQN